MGKIRSSEITPEGAYLTRRQFIAGAGAALWSGGILAACAAPETASPETSDPPPTAEPTAASTAAVEASPSQPQATSSVPVVDEPLTDYEAVTGYVNFYEFTTSKEGVAKLAEGFQSSPWQVEVGGMVNSPKTFDLDDIRAFGEEERIYRMRCVEAWSMVIPWLGFPLSRLLDAVEPLSGAKYVGFETLYDPEQMPGQQRKTYPWPYVEGLSVEEAMHDLTILSTGLYGEALLPQNGAPVRLVVPWKYGFKSIKSIVKIDLVDEMPESLWMASSPVEYGFWANVNPEVPHRRWSQATERRIGEGGRRETLFFNGYAEQVAHLYPDLDNQEWYY